FVARSSLEGCLSAQRFGRAPHFQLNREQREAIAAFLKKGDLLALTRQVPHEFAARETERLRCADCHEKLEGLPRLSLAGGKLKPEWMEPFIAGQISYKPRPWLASRMPAFPADAPMLARGLAALHGSPPTNSSEPSVDSQLASTGAKLVSAAGGF